MRAALPTAHASGPALAARPARPSVRAAATPSPPPRDTSSSAAPPTKSGYPDMETSAADTGLLPRREPGSFPSPTLVAAWNRLSVELLEGADTGAPPAAAGEEAAYDPLRDGPARYLGYSNECGCVFFFFRTAAKTEERVGVGWPGWPPPRVCPGGCACAHACGGGGSLRGSARLAPPLARGRPGIWAGGATVGRRERRQKKAARARGGRATWPPPGRVHTPAPSAVVFGRRPGLNVAAERIAGPPSRAARPQIGVPPKKHARLGARPRAPQPAHPPQKRAAVGAPHPLPPLSTLKNSEAFAAWLPPFGVPLSYAIAIGYVLVDTVDKGLKAYARAKDELEGGATPVRADVDTGRLALLLAAERTVDTVVWQLLASVFVPGYTIHTVVAAVHAGLGPLEALPAVQEAAAGLASAFGAPSGAALLAVVDKSLPTVAGLAGAFL